MGLGGLATAAFTVGTLGNSVKAVPQFYRTALRGRVAGLSPGAVWIACSAQVLWLSFGVAIEDWRFVALGAIQTLLTFGTLVRFVSKTGWTANTRAAAVALPAWGACALMATSDSELVLESIGAGLGLVVGAPQLLFLWRRRNTTVDVTGVSQVEYIVVIAAQVAWMTYWLVKGHPVAAAGAAWGGAARSTTFALLRRQRRRSSTLNVLQASRRTSTR